ncbi:DNA polymerase delta catalytic subunit [Rhizophlyctis rosea]|nr:DNA polymerase delta catalytic subunit [Rhizophlyctis rosea]
MVVRTDGFSDNHTINDDLVAKEVAKNIAESMAQFILPITNGAVSFEEVMHVVPDITGLEIRDLQFTLDIFKGSDLNNARIRTERFTIKLWGGHLHYDAVRERVLVSVRKVQTTIGYIDDIMTLKMRNVGGSWDVDLDVPEIYIRTSQHIVDKIIVLFNFNVQWIEYYMIYNVDDTVRFRHVHISDVQMRFKYYNSPADYKKILKGNWRYLRNMPADRYPSYSLDTVAEKEIGEQKRDVDAKDIFQAFRSGDTTELTKIGDYCCQDTMLVQKLVNKLDVVTQMFEMANITDTPPMYLLQKGQQIKCFSQISKEAMEKGFLIPLAEEREDGKFKGAIVLDPIIGKYDSPVAVLDFASLYPSIQMAYKVCYTTIVLDKNLHNHIMRLKEEGKPLVVKGVKFDVIEWDEDTFVFHDVSSGKKYEFTDMEDAKKMGFTEKQIRASMSQEDHQRIDSPAYWTAGIKHHAYAFAQVESSIIPDLQDRLKKSRKAVKAMMAPIEHSKNPDDQLKYRVLNGRQLAIKVSMNSIYGFTSAFMMNLQALSASVTAQGRKMIEQTKSFLENDFEKIARSTLWTKEDYLTFFVKDGKQILAQEVNGEWIFAFRGEEICRTRIGEMPEGWIKKFPTAMEGKPWTNHDLSIRVVAGDTDSCFANFPTCSLAEAISLSHKAAELLTEDIFNRKPIEMEYEKTYYPLYIQKKKNYIGLKYEMDDPKILLSISARMTAVSLDFIMWFTSCSMHNFHLSHMLSMAGGESGSAHRFLMYSLEHWITSANMMFDCFSMCLSRSEASMSMVLYAP